MIRNIAIIPARSGSKGVKDKNIRELLGKPLLAYSIEAAEKSGCFDNIFVSTDDEILLCGATTTQLIPTNYFKICRKL